MWRSAFVWQAQCHHHQHHIHIRLYAVFVHGRQKQMELYQFLLLRQPPSRITNPHPFPMSSQPSPYNLFSFCCCCCYRWQHGIVFGVWIRNSLHVMYSLGWCSSTHFSQHHERARQPHRYIHESCTCIESAIDGGLVALSCAADEMHNRHVELEGRMARDMNRIQGNQLFPIRINSIETKLYFPLLTLNCVDVLFC